MTNLTKRQELMKKDHAFQFTFGQRIYNYYIKRILDVLLAVTALLVLSPVFVLVPLAIMIGARSLKAPVFFVQKRCGLDGKSFNIYKFRSMLIHAPSAMPTSDFCDSDLYITKVGSFLRKTSLDELPQLFNVLKGDMSLVGPRPLIPQEVEIDQLRHHFGIYALRPGITGYAQVSGRDNMDIYTKTRFDRQYLEKISFCFDLKVLWKTFVVVIKRENIAF